MTTTNAGAVNPLLQAFIDHRVVAEVFECDHYRIRGGLAVETDYIITVHPTETTTAAVTEDIVLFEPFCISKNYSLFRTFAIELKKFATQISVQKNEPSKAIKEIWQYCENVYRLVETQQSRTYLGKVNFMYVKLLAKQRKSILNDVLSSTCNFYPSSTALSSLVDQHEKEILHAVSNVIETFFLTDHVEQTSSDTAVIQALGNRATSTLLIGKTTTSDEGSKATLKKETSIKTPFALLAKTTGAATKVLSTAANVASDGVKTATDGVRKTTDTVIRHTVGSGSKPSAVDTATTTPATSMRASIAIVPLSTRSRLSDEKRTLEELELSKLADEEPKLTVEVDGKADSSTAEVKAPSYSNPKPTVNFKATGGESAAESKNSLSAKISQYFETNPMVFAAIMVGCISFIKAASQKQLTVDGDICLLLIFAAFCIGLHTPRPIIGGYDTPTSLKGVVVRTKSTGRIDASGRQLLRASMMYTNLPSAKALGSSNTDEKSTKEATSDEVVTEPSLVPEETVLGSPLDLFPEGAKIGSHNNCYSEPDPGDFVVRGPTYFTDKKKIASGEYLFPSRGVDLFLTDSCPENVGSNPGVFGGRLREKATFIINFRLPWGVLIFYYEIPEKLVPFLRSTEEPDFDKTAIPALSTLTNPERAVARFLLGNGEHRNKVLKIVPVVIDGPWVVKSVVGGKPAIIGKKVPISYIYQPPVDNKALYLEADLDIAASSAARGILSVTRSYTQILTINLGFVIEGCFTDELPEQMLTGTRLHGIDPLTAPSYPIDASTEFLHPAGSVDESQDFDDVDTVS